jgi:hypothetical protein
VLSFTPAPHHRQPTHRTHHIRIAGAPGRDNDRRMSECHV